MPRGLVRLLEAVGDLAAAADLEPRSRPDWSAAVWLVLHPETGIQASGLF
jgi:hypothetical protein